MQIEKELISLEPLSFERIEKCLADVKELPLKLSECKNYFFENDGEFIELILKNLKTTYDVLCSTFCDN
jgi:hypothetical protein